MPAKDIYTHQRSVVHMFGNPLPLFVSFLFFVMICLCLFHAECGVLMLLQHGSIGWKPADINEVSIVYFHYFWVGKLKIDEYWHFFLLTNEFLHSCRNSEVEGNWKGRKHP